MCICLQGELRRELCKLLNKVWPVIITMDVLNPRKVELDAEDKVFVKALMRGETTSTWKCVLHNINVHDAL